MSSLFPFVCTKTTADFVVPVSASSQQEFNRKVHNAFAGMVGGVLRVGDIKWRTSQEAIPNHLLCDGSTITRAMFPQLVDLLNPGGATATLPNYTGPVESAPITVTQTVETGGTVTTDAGATHPPAPTGGTTEENVPSGGRPLRGQYDDIYTVEP